MRLVTSIEMKSIEERAMTEFGLNAEILMDNAAQAVVKILKAEWGPESARAAIFCGKGNNAGDGWAIAHHLKREGWTVKVFHPGREMPLSPEADLNRGLALECGVPDGSWQEGIEEAKGYDLVIDALLGTGVRGQVSAEWHEVISGINRSGLPVMAVDIPSGISANTGQVAGIAVEATWTVTFGCPKIGLAVYPGREYAGELFIDPIGIPEELLLGGDIQTISSIDVGGKLPKRPINTHKGRNGHLLVVGGSDGMTGAPVLSGMAGLRSGAGLVTIGRRVGLTIPEKPAELMAADWPLIDWERYDSIVFGPGLSLEEDGETILKRLLKMDIPRVIDADGLNLLAELGTEEMLKKAEKPIILTPHPGEMARLCGLSIAQVQSDRVAIAQEKARIWGAVLVLKGAATIVTSPCGKVWVNTTGNPGMATGGTGDVLTGVIGALLAQGLQPEDAAIVGVYLHGLAGDLAAEAIGEVGLIAGDLLIRLPQAIRSVKQGDSLQR